MHERPAIREDLPALVALWHRFEIATSGTAEADEAEVRRDWDAPGFDLARSTRVLEDGGEQVGYAVLGASGDCDSVVDPARAGEGLEESLLGWLEGRGDRIRTPLHHYWTSTDEVGAGRFTRRGWQASRLLWRMRVELDGPLPAPAWPPGTGVRDFELERDARTAHEVVETAFLDVGDDRPTKTYDEWAAAMLDPARVDPTLYLVAVEGERVVGVCLSQLLGDLGFVRQLAVPRAERRRGLGLALLHESFRRHAARGLPATILGVDAVNATGATALYERAGMRVVERYTRWDRALTP